MILDLILLAAAVIIVVEGVKRSGKKRKKKKKRRELSGCTFTVYKTARGLFLNKISKASKIVEMKTCSSTVFEVEIISGRHCDVNNERVVPIFLCKYDLILFKSSLRNWIFVSHSVN